MTNTIDVILNELIELRGYTKGIKSVLIGDEKQIECLSYLYNSVSTVFLRVKTLKDELLNVNHDEQVPDSKFEGLTVTSMDWDNIKLKPEDFKSRRTFNVLFSEKIVTIGDLLRKKETDLLKYPNLGKISLSEIKEFLAQYNLSLKDIYNV